MAANQAVIGCRMVCVVAIVLCVLPKLALADELADQRLSELCYSIETATAYDVDAKKKQGYSPDDSYRKIAGGLKEEMAKNPKATGPGSDAVNDFNDALIEHQTKIIHDMVVDAAEHRLFSPDKAYPNYAMRCFQEMRQVQAEIAAKHRDELEAIKNKGDK